MKFALQFCVLVSIGFATQFTFAQQASLTILQVKAGEFEKAVDVPVVDQVTETYEVEVPYTESEAQEYEVQVPYTETVPQTYTVNVPYSETETQPDGSKKMVTKTREEKRTRAVPVTKMRTEKRTRMVPVKKTRTEERTRQVPVARTETRTLTVKFPAKNASFMYASGEEISIEKIKTLAAESILLIELSPGESLTDAQRQLLKPDTIVMSFPAPAEKDAGDEEE